MQPVYLNNWSSKEDMIASFEEVYDIDKLTQEQKDKYGHVNVLLATYGCDNYSGDAFVLFQDARSGYYYEVNGSHCSCYGLEGQWSEEQTNLESLRHRVNEGRLGCDDYTGNLFRDELIAILDELQN